jgi:hypothetical protein
MNDTSHPSSPDVGSQPSPAAAIEPAGAGAPAPSVSPPAISGSAPTPGTTAPSSGLSPADAAFDEFISGPTVPDNSQQTPPAPSPTPAPVAPPQDQQPPQSPPPADTSDGTDLEAQLAPSVDDQAKGFVPLKKLTRALEVRRKALDQNKELEARLASESKLVDRVLDTFNAAGVGAQQLPTFLATLQRAKSDPAAQAALLAHFGVQPQPAKPAFDTAEVLRRLEDYDVDGAMSIMRGQAPQTTPPAAAPLAPATPPPVAQPAAQPPPSDQPDPGQVQLQAQVHAMGQTLKATFGPQEATRLSKLIDEAATARLNELESYGVSVSTQAVAKVYLEAQGKVLQAEQQRRSQPVPPPPSQPIRPAPVPPARAQNADDLFESEFGRRR